MKEQDFSNFVAERDAAYLSMDESRIRAYMTKHGVPAPANPETFWISVHMTRTGAKSLPIEARRESKRWLSERGYRSMDDGELS